MKNPIGIYEKALPKDLDWPQRFKAAREAGYDFLEISVDETPERMARLDWSASERMAFYRASREAGVMVPSMCLSGHRKIPFGSADAQVRAQADTFMHKAITFAADTGIRVIQLAGYDVYYEPTTAESRARYLQGMQRALEVAARHQVMLALEIMDAWGNDVAAELAAGIHHIVGVHVKESKPVGPGFAGAFRDVPFGEGTVDFVQCFRTLHDLKYSGPFLVEMWTEKSADPLLEIRKARQWVGERLQAGGYA